MGADLYVHTAYNAEELGHVDFGPANVFNMGAERSTRFINRYDRFGNRIQFIEAMAAPFAPVDACTWDVLHLAPVMGEISLGSWLGTHEARVIGAGLQGWLRGPLSLPGRVVPRAAEFEPSVLSKLDAVFCSEEDLEGHGELLRLLCRYVRVVVVTYGSRGAIVWEQGVPNGVGVHDVVDVDPTGAGDTFAAVMLPGLARDWSPRQSALTAAALASCTVETKGVPATEALIQATSRREQIPYAATG